jgi:hypothetical protein
VIFRFTTARGRGTLPAKLVAVLGLVLMVILMVGVFSPCLHDRVCHHHEDATGGDQCVLAAFASGELGSLPVDLQLTLPTAWVERVLVSEVVSSEVRMDHRLLPSCGPPNGGQFA